MNLVKRFLEKMNGMQYRQEYLCFTGESFEQPLNVYLVENGRILCDITNLHRLVGYHPLIFALPFDLCKKWKADPIHVLFSPLKLNGFISKKDAIASLHLKKIAHQSIDENIVCYYEGVKGQHRFLSGFNQAIIHIHNNLFGKRPGNVFLKGNLYSQVQIGYAVPRKICLITVGQNGLYNQFPTDLHGQVGEGHYLISLRHEGNACKQVESAQKIVLSDMEAGAYKKVYALGKNHMQPLKDRTAFDFGSENSKEFGLPIPKNAVAYKELELASCFIKGIHQLMLFKIVYSKNIQVKPSTLVHVHNSFATWRNRHGMEGNYLLR